MLRRSLLESTIRARNHIQATGAYGSGSGRPLRAFPQIPQNARPFSGWFMFFHCSCYFSKFMLLIGWLLFLFRYDFHVICWDELSSNLSSEIGILFVNLSALLSSFCKFRNKYASFCVSVGKFKYIWILFSLLFPRFEIKFSLRSVFTSESNLARKMHFELQNFLADKKYFPTLEAHKS